MALKTVALLHPGEMGAAIGACLGGRGLRVVWASARRSAATRSRASAAGPPPVPGVSSRIYLSGGRARDVAAVFAGSNLEAIPLEGPAGAASALKACYAAWTKGATALLAAIRALATREGVEAALLEEWKRSQPDLPKRTGPAPGQPPTPPPGPR